MEARLQRLETQMAGITHTVRESGQVFSQLGNVESAVSRISGSLETFLSRIQIEEDMRLIPAHRRLGPGGSLDIEPQLEIDVEMYHMEGVVDPRMLTDNDGDTSRSPIPTPGTPSEDLDNGRMQIPSGSVDTSAPASAAVEASNVAQASAPLPPPPTVNVIPPTPQNSQTTGDGVRSPQAKATPSISDPAPSIPEPAPSTPEPDPSIPEAPFPQSEHAPPPASLILPIQTRGRSHTPIILLQPDAGLSFLSPAVSPSAAGSGPITCSRSWSLSKNPLD